MNQKLENLLQLALQTPEETRERTDNLNVGFDASTRTWELIVKYHGSLEGLAALHVRVEELIANYAILTVPEQLVEAVAELDEIEYVEKPKRYFYEVTNPTRDSCVVQVTGRDFLLSGAGVLIAVLDSGIDYRLPEFQNKDGSTRISYLWDQTLNGDGAEQKPPSGFYMGVEFSAAQINRALQAQTREEQFALLPSVDSGGHGTAVAGIAAGGSDKYEGMAPGASLLIVKLGLPDASSFPRTTEIMRGVAWALRRAMEMQMPLVMNLSFGNSYGAHDGSSLLERFLDNASEIGRTVICVGSGNDGAAAGHLEGRIEQDIPGRGTAGIGANPDRFRTGTGLPAAVAELAVGTYESSLSVQLWKNYSDVYHIRLRSPGGEESELPLSVNGGKYTLRLEQTEILVYIGEPTPYAAPQEIYLEMIPTARPYINGGVWSIRLEAIELVTGQYYFYLPSAAARSDNTGFYRPTPEVTLTIPATAAKVITVGAYDSIYDSYADFSGRGYGGAERTIGVVAGGITKPDLVAPGVEVLAPNLYGSLTPVTGTSFATPIVTGAAALLMEWGIVLGKDPFLYGEKVKAYLRRGARPLRGETVYPNEKVGDNGIIVSS